jgi:hypothetical protein
MAALLPSSTAFARACRSPQEAQRAAFVRLQNNWRGTALAKRQPDLLRVRTVAELAQAVPLSTYDDVELDLDAAARGERYARSASALVRFERSGGSSGVQKLLPLTKAFLSDVQRGLSPWLFDLYRHQPGLRTGSAYWSISPIGKKAAPTAGGVPVGADDDSSYLPAPIAGLLSQVMVATPALARFPDIDSCRYATLRLLLQRDDLALVSVWSPTFLTLLLDVLDEHAERLLDDLARGLCRVPRVFGDPTRDDAVAAAVKLSPIEARARRAEALRRAMARHGRLRPVDVWPRLELVSMWQDGESRRYVGDVVKRLPGVPLQAKGLLATEGIVTVPMTSAPAPVLCINSHVYEFLLDDGRVVQPHELCAGQTAEVVLSTSAGLVRYRLGDRVVVDGHFERTPCLRFVGRSGVVSDLVGEKIAADRVASVFADAAMVVGTPRFAMLVPWRKQRARYRLYVDGYDEVQARAFAVAVDAGLAAGHPYRYARDLGQLAPVEVVTVPGALRRYEEACVARGQRAGDIKGVSLALDDTWHAVFDSDTDRGNDAQGRQW